jgi:hypothetical protein
MHLSLTSEPARLSEREQDQLSYWKEPRSAKRAALRASVTGAVPEGTSILADAREMQHLFSAIFR